MSNIYDDIGSAVAWAQQSAETAAAKGRAALVERIAALETDVAKLKLVLHNLTGVDFD